MTALGRLLFYVAIYVYSSSIYSFNIWQNGLHRRGLWVLWKTFCKVAYLSIVESAQLPQPSFAGLL
jgi:hypothetical protein